MPTHAVGDGKQTNRQRGLAMLRKHKMQRQAGIFVPVAYAPRIGSHAHLQILRPVKLTVECPVGGRGFEWLHIVHLVMSVPKASVLMR